MLRPQDNEVRETKRLDGIWDFVVDFTGVGREQRWWERPLAGAQKMPVPSSYNDVLVDPAVHDHVGDVWYQRTVFVPRGWTGMRTVLRFDAATHRATVWVDDVEVLEHEGGYTPFEVEVTDNVREGESFRLTVVVNNELTWESIPPGTIETKPNGVRRQHYYHDFFNYAGLHRSVWIYATPQSYITDITVVTDIEADRGIVRYAAVVETQGSSEVRAALLDATGTVVAQATGVDGLLRVEQPELWRPGRGYLYRLQTDVVEGDRMVDRYVLPVGIRTVAVLGSQFLINDEPFYFRGFGKHEDLNVRGRGHDDAAMVQDFALFGWMGANSFRTSHYPYAEEVLEHADRLGIVVIDETAAVGLNLGVGGDLFLGGPKITFSEETIGAAAQQAHRRAIEELIARDKNHPCVAVWSLANEPESHTEAARTYFEPLFDVARNADPTPSGRLREHDVRPAGRLQGDCSRRPRHD